MKLFAIRDGADDAGKDLAYLIYYEVDKRFYIELPENADPWETPLLLSGFAKRGEKTVNSYWSKIWVRQRIVPPDRQNIGQILRDNGLKMYDEYRLLVLSGGRCAQDEYYLAPIETEMLPDVIKQRFGRKVEDVVPLPDNRLLVFFHDGTIRKCDMTWHFRTVPQFSVLLTRPELFSKVRIQSGGYGIEWDEMLSVPDEILYKMGKRIPLAAADFRFFASERIINSLEAAEILGCSRQYVSELVKTGKLEPVKTSEKNTLFLKSDVLKRNWQ